MITSLSNPQIRHIQLLEKKARHRQTQKQYVAEGRRMVMETPKELLVKIYLSEEFVVDTKLQEWLADKPLEVVSANVFRGISGTRTPQGILAVVRMSDRDPAKMLCGSSFLILENLQDPGNLGTMIRTAEGAGMDGVFLSGTCVDIYNPKVVRATMGSMYRVPFFYAEDFPVLLRKMREEGIQIFAADLEESMPYYEADLTGRCAVMIGNEANGLSEKALALADSRIRIPMAGQLESLNAAMAAGILMYEMQRQKAVQ